MRFQRWILFGAMQLACGAKPKPTAVPTPLPAFHAPVPRAPAVAVPGERLRAIVVDDGLPVPRDWVAERPALDGVWPKQPAFALRESWVASSHTVCREAVWSSAANALASAHPWFVALRLALVGDERSMRAERTDDSARAILAVERACLHHECRPPLAPPLTTLTVCVDGLDASSMRGFTRAMMSLQPSIAPLAPVLDLGGVSELVAHYERDRNGWGEVEVTLAVTADGQSRARNWLLASGYATADASIAWALDSPDPRRSFIVYPIESAPGTFSISGR